MLDKDFNEALEEIEYKWDGPVTNYVAIFRALRMAKNKPEVSIDRIAEALLEALDIPSE